MLFREIAKATSNCHKSWDLNQYLDAERDRNCIAVGNATVVSQGVTKSLSYVVDGFGRRVARKVGTNFDRAWLYRDGLRPVSEVDAAGTFTHFVYADSQLGAPDFLIRSGVLYRVVKDHIGSVRIVVNAQTGAVAQSLDYDEFGVVLVDSNPGFQPFGFAGGLYDADTGLLRFGARDYDALTGRWTNKDPIGFGGGDTNVHAYVGDDPVNGRDPSGLEIVATDFIGPIHPGDQRGLTCEQKKALTEILAREKRYGTQLAARKSSVTFGDRLLEPFNSSFGNSVPTKFGHMDLDWFTDVRALQIPGMAGRHVTPITYIMGKLYWTYLRRQIGFPIGHALPFEDPTEIVAVTALRAGARYRDLFTEEFFHVYRPENECN